MPLLVVPALVLAGLVALAGAMKLIDPSMTVGAVRAVGLPSSPLLVRVGAAAELGLGVTALVAGGEVAWGLVALSYAVFAVFVAWALRRGTAIGTCGCFGRADTPPHPLHVAIDLALSVLALMVARSLHDAPMQVLADHPGAGGVAGLVAATAIGALVVVFTRGPAIERLR